MTVSRSLPEHAALLDDVAAATQARRAAAAAADAAIERAIVAGVPAAAIGPAAGMTPGALRMAVRRDRCRPADHPYRRFPNLNSD